MGKRFIWSSDPSERHIMAWGVLQYLVSKTYLSPNRALVINRNVLYELGADLLQTHSFYDV